MGFATKMEWASAKATSISNQIAAIQSERLPSSEWRKIRRREETISRLRSEEAKYRRLATRFRALGV